MFQIFQRPTSDHFVAIICCGHAEKSVHFHFVGSGKFVLHNIWLLNLPQKSFQNAPECLKWVMIGLSCKWSLTFHRTSCLSSLMATAPWNCYVRDIYACPVWLTRPGTCLEGEVKVWGRGPAGAAESLRNLRIFASSHHQSVAFVAFVRREEALMSA